MSSQQLQLIPEFYAGRSVFITGATGFMGKVLIERLLSTCPDIGRLFLLMRTKKDVAPETRLLLLKQSKVFDVLREKTPSQLEKLVLVPGDVCEPQLGISMQDLAMLHDTRSVSMVFHSAATVKFNEELGKAVEQNVRSVMSVLDICDRLPNVEVFVHVSTAYSNCEQSYIEERVYPAPAPLGRLLALVDAAPPELLAEITNKYIAPKPNTYTFTKAMAENVIEQHRRKNYSVAIYRPPIVVSSIRDPFPGWIENLNGPSGMVVAAGKGLLHVLNYKRSARADLMPVDIAIDILIAVGWETGIEKWQDVRVYNCSTSENPATWQDFRLGILKNLSKYPLDDAVWYPYGITIETECVGIVCSFLMETVPMFLMEHVTNLLGIRKKVNLIAADQKIRTMGKALKFFSTQEFRFETSNVRRLRARLAPPDALTYNLDVNTIQWDEHFRTFVIGIRKYLLEERDEDLDKAKERVRRLRWLHWCVSLCSLALFLRALLRTPPARTLRARARAQTRKLLGAGNVS